MIGMFCVDTQKSLRLISIIEFDNHTLQPAIWTANAIGNSDHIYVTRNDR